MRKVCRKKVQDDKLLLPASQWMEAPSNASRGQSEKDCQAQLGIGERKLDRDERTLVFTSYSTMQH